MAHKFPKSSVTVRALCRVADPKLPTSRIFYSYLTWQVITNPDPASRVISYPDPTTGSSNIFLNFVLYFT